MLLKAPGRQECRQECLPHRAGEGMALGRFSVLLLGLLAAGDLPGATLQPKTLAGWQNYVRLTEQRVERELARERWEDHEQQHGSDIPVVRMQTADESGRPVTAEDGMIHHWKGSVLIPAVTLEEVLQFVQNYDQHHRFFQEVEQSRLLSRDGDTFRIFFRLKRTKVITAIYNTEHTVVYRRHGPRRASSRSVSTRIAELEAPGTPAEKEKPEGRDRGFLWRANGYWRFVERPGGVVVEWESLSLSRSIPSIVAWLIRGYVESVPRESLVNTLSSLRDGLRKQ